MDISIYTDQGNYVRYRGQDEYRWINENSYKYGLIRRYSGEKNTDLLEIRLLQEFLLSFLILHRKTKLCKTEA